MIEQNNRISSTQGYGRPSTSSPGKPPNGVSDFEKLLRQQHAQQQSRKAQQVADLPLERDPNAVRFSKHALERLEKRQIDLAPEQSQRLQSAVQSAASKGARQSLVLMDGIAFVVNVQERTVVTAINANANQHHSVFTNIDSAVLA